MGQADLIIAIFSLENKSLNSLKTACHWLSPIPSLSPPRSNTFMFSWPMRNQQKDPMGFKFPRSIILPQWEWPCQPVPSDCSCLGFRGNLKDVLSIAKNNTIRDFYSVGGGMRDGRDEKSASYRWSSVNKLWAFPGLFNFGGDHIVFTLCSLVPAVGMHNWRALSHITHTLQYLSKSHVLSCQ